MRDPGREGLHSEVDLGQEAEDHTSGGETDPVVVLEADGTKVKASEVYGSDEGDEPEADKGDENQEAA